MMQRAVHGGKRLMILLAARTRVVWRNLMVATFGACLKIVGGLLGSTKRSNKDIALSGICLAGYREADAVFGKCGT
jgi:hypothetical protein